MAVRLFARSSPKVTDKPLRISANDESLITREGDYMQIHSQFRQ